MSHSLVLALLLIADGQTQTAPATPRAPSSGSAVTRSLNAAPPSAVAVPPTPRPTTIPATPPTAASPVAAPPPAATPATPPATTPSVATPPATSPATPPTRTPPATTPSVATPPRATTPAVPVGAAPRPSPAPPLTEPSVAPVEPPPPPPPAVLDAAAVAALPFTVELPTGFSVTAGRPGPNFNIWTIRRGSQPLVMVYAGPASQFPIYSGEMVEAGGRASVVATEEGRRVALEHLFTRPAAPEEIHVWITSVEGADRVLAERIGQSIDVR